MSACFVFVCRFTVPPPSHSIKAKINVSTYLCMRTRWFTTINSICRKHYLSTAVPYLQSRTVVLANRLLIRCPRQFFNSFLHAYLKIKATESSSFSPILVGLHLEKSVSLFAQICIKENNKIK